MNAKKLHTISFLVCALLFSLSSCTGDGNKGNDEIDDVVGSNTDPSHVTKINGRLFSIPSPVQTAHLIQNSGAKYNSKLLHNPNEVARYSTKVQRGLNLGVYGADLGYVNMYSQTQDAVVYLGACKKLADDLGVSGAFSPELMKKFETHLGQTDSLLLFAGEAFRITDEFLQTNENNDVGSLVLAGGWIESLHFATNVYKTSPTDALKQRIGEQKFSIINLIKLLEAYSNGEDYGDLIESLYDLSSVFEKVEVNYEYAKPEIDTEKKLAVINSSTSISISEEQITEITQKVDNIRRNITE